VYTTAAALITRDLSQHSYGTGGARQVEYPAYRSPAPVFLDSRPRA